MDEYLNLDVVTDSERPKIMSFKIFLNGHESSTIIYVQIGQGRVLTVEDNRFRKTKWPKTISFKIFLNGHEPSTMNYEQIV